MEACAKELAARAAKTRRQEELRLTDKFQKGPFLENAMEKCQKHSIISLENAQNGSGRALLI